MSVVKSGLLLKKALVACILSLTITTNTVSAMWSSTLDEWNPDQLTKLLAEQNYEYAFQYIIRPYMETKPLPAAADWLNWAAYEQYHVPCMYERFRWFITSHQHVAPSKSYLEDVLAWIIIAMVLTKADVDCCLKLHHLFKNPKHNPFDLLMANYAHRLNQCNASYQINYSSILDKAKKIFGEITIVELPLPLWVCTVENTALASQWVDFGLTSIDVSRRAGLHETYLLPHIIAEVKKIRTVSHQVTWEKLALLRDWSEFFALRSTDFKALIISNDLSMSTLQAYGQQSEPKSNNDGWD